MSRFEHRFKVDLRNSSTRRQGSALMMMGDANGDRILVEVYSNGIPQALSGAIVADVILPNEESMLIQGNNSTGFLDGSGNSIVYVDLPASVYLLPGMIRIAIKEVTNNGSDVNTLIQLTASVCVTSTGSVIDPGSVIPSLEQIREIAENAEYASSFVNNFDVQNLVRLTVDASRSSKVTIGTGTGATTMSHGGISSSSGTNTGSQDYPYMSRTAYINFSGSYDVLLVCDPGTVSRVFFYNGSTFLSTGEAVNGGIGRFTAPSGTTRFRAYVYRKSDKDNGVNVGNPNIIYTDVIAGFSMWIIPSDRVIVSGTTASITAMAGVRYICGEVSTISFTPASYGVSDVTFTSGSTAAVLTVPNTVKWPDWFDPTALEANTTYELNIVDGVYGVVGKWT